jgi:hypothetical protein
LKNAAQTLAILAAGTWAVVEFGINEERLSFKLNTTVSAELGPLIPAKGAVPPHRPVSFSIQLHNVGEDPGQIALAALSVTGNTNGATDGFPRPYFEHGSNPIADFAFIDWAAERADLSYTFFAPSVYVQPNETIGDASVVLAANPEMYDSLTYFLIVWAMESCTDLGSATCAKVSASVDGLEGIDCAPGSDRSIGAGYCGQFYRSIGPEEPQPVSVADMRLLHGLTDYTYEGLLVLPPAPVASGAAPASP